MTNQTFREPISAEDVAKECEYFQAQALELEWACSHLLQNFQLRTGPLAQLQHARRVLVKAAESLRIAGQLAQEVQ